MATGTHEYHDDPRNADVLIHVNGHLVPRNQATVSVFDSGFILGDGVWEGLRLHHGRFAFLDAHLDRLYDGAKALDLDIGLDRAALTRTLHETMEANDMRDGVHVRLMVTRGLKRTPYQDPRVCVGPSTVVIIPEYKQALPETVENGIRLFTVHVRRGAPDGRDALLLSSVRGLESWWLEEETQTFAMQHLGDTAWEEGVYETFDAAGTSLDLGKYIVIWKRIDGAWLIARDIMSTNRATA